MVSVRKSEFAYCESGHLVIVTTPRFFLRMLLAATASMENMASLICPKAMRLTMKATLSSYMVAVSITYLSRAIFRASTFYLTDSIVTFIERGTLKAAASPSIFPRMMSPLAYSAS